MAVFLSHTAKAVTATRSTAKALSLFTITPEFLQIQLANAIGNWTYQIVVVEIDKL
jgi:hypothetical protein